MSDELARKLEQRAMAQISLKAPTQTDRYDADLDQEVAKKIRALEAENADLRDGRGVKVKPLEWTGPRETDGIHHAYDAECPIGHYIASVTDDGRALAFRVGHGGSMYPDGGAVEDAKAAAQADYERRILSALSPAPVSVGEDDLRDAFIAGATAVHFQWQKQYHDGIPPPRHTDFYEAADDYATAALRALSEGEG